MASQEPPRIFSPARRLAARRWMLGERDPLNGPNYLMTDMVDDVLDRLSFLRIVPRNALVIGEWFGRLADTLAHEGAAVTSVEPGMGFDEEQPYPFAGFDLIASLGTLDTVNDLPGALVHIRKALAPGGLMIASFTGAGSLPKLRAAMLAADGDRPAPRIHPQIDVRAGGQLLQRTGFADPVVDSRSLDVSFRSLDSLVEDLRTMGLSNVLARSGPPLTRMAREIARDAFAAAGEDGRTIERFEILTLSGWRK